MGFLNSLYFQIELKNQIKPNDLYINFMVFSGIFTEERNNFKMRAAVRALFIFAVIGFVAPKPYGGQTDTDLSPWAQAHMNEVREMANKLRNEYNIQASGRSSGMLNLLRVCFYGVWDFQN